MSAWNFLLGATDLTGFIPARQSAWREAFREGMIIVGIILLISVVIFVWAAYLRKRPRRRKHHHQHISIPPSADPAAPDGTTAASEGEEGGSRRRRHSRHRHRQMNRTLAETKGLPPVRDSQSPPRGL